jgi:hypothetical protein
MALLIFFLVFLCSTSYQTNLVLVKGASTFNLDEDGTRNDQDLVFVERSKGLPKTGDYNFIAMEDINKDNEIDIAFGAGGWPIPTTLGLYTYFGDGGETWVSESSGLTTRNTWGGLELVDADFDGDIELYAPDESWGSSSNSGLKVWEYRDSSWTDSQLHVSTPLSYGQPNNVVLRDITGNSRPDLVVCKKSGLSYFQNNGGNPAIWEDLSEGLSKIREFTGAAVADINKDGLKDIIASDYTGNEYIYVQSSTGDLWSDYSSSLDSGGITYGIAIDDVNIDSHMDLVFGTTGGGLLCWLGNSGGVDGTNFQWVNGSADLITSNIYNQIQLVDIDLDDDLDIIAPEGKNGKGIQIYLGNGNTDPGMDIGWTLAENTNLPSSNYWYGANCYDINDDGALDIVGASWGAGVRVWLNNINGNIDDHLEQFNLRITDEDITLSQEPLINGDEVTIYATVMNVGDWDASEFSVKFYIDDDLIDNQVDFNFLEANDDIQLEKTWTATEGEHTILVEIETLNTDLESDITDNSAEIKISVEENDHGGESNNDTKSSTLEQSILIFILIIIIVVVLLVIFFARRKSKSTKFIVVEPIDDTEDDN